MSFTFTFMSVAEVEWLSRWVCVTGRSSGNPWVVRGLLRSLLVFHSRERSWSSHPLTQATHFLYHPGARELHWSPLLQKQICPCPTAALQISSDRTVKALCSGVQKRQTCGGYLCAQVHPLPLNGAQTLRVWARFDYNMDLPSNEDRFSHSLRLFENISSHIIFGENFIYIDLQTWKQLWHT